MALSGSRPACLLLPLPPAQAFLPLPSGLFLAFPGWSLGLEGGNDVVGLLSEDSLGPELLGELAQEGNVLEYAGDGGTLVVVDEGASHVPACLLVNANSYIFYGTVPIEDLLHCLVGKGPGHSLHIQALVLL